MIKRWRYAAIGCAVVMLVLASQFLRTGLSKDERRLFSQITQGPHTKENQLGFNSTKNVRLVSFNLWCDYFKPYAHSNINERMESLAEGIKDFDIALIQEAFIWKTGIAVFTKCALLLIAVMEKHGFLYRTSIADFVAPRVGKSGGIVIFSRIPLARTVSKLYRNYSISNLMEYRGFVVGEFFFNSQHLYVVNTHLDPSGVQARALQVQELLTNLQNITDANSHFVVAGDFNIDNNYPTTSNSSKEYKELLQAMRKAGVKPVFPVRMETNTDGGLIS
ncbi:uncharacterized protein LOC144641553 isoform X2 [Oculina patagonica]